MVQAAGLAALHDAAVHGEIPDGGGVEQRDAVGAVEGYGAADAWLGGEALLQRGVVRRGAREGLRGEQGERERLLDEN